MGLGFGCVMEVGVWVEERNVMMRFGLGLSKRGEPTREVEVGRGDIGGRRKEERGKAAEKTKKKKTCRALVFKPCFRSFLKIVN